MAKVMYELTGYSLNDVQVRELEKAYGTPRKLELRILRLLQESWDEKPYNDFMNWVDNLQYYA